ncbi:MAG: hypothetical protein CMF48_02765 [Legionellales bacterium]|nr:hypothetical protein [Legionellales bacterium]
MGKNTKINEVEARNYLKQIGEQHVKKGSYRTLIMPDPKVKDVRCQERAILYAVLRKKYLVSPGLLTAEDYALIGAGIVLTLNKHEYDIDGFGIVYNESIHEEALKFPILEMESCYASKGKKKAFFKFCAETLASACSEYIRKNGGVSEEYYQSASGEDFTHPTLNIKINPFYPAGLALLNIVYNYDIIIGIHSTNIKDVDEGKQEYIGQKLIFIKGSRKPDSKGRFVVLPKGEVPAYEPVVLFKGLQVLNEGQQDQLAQVEKGDILPSDLLLSQFAAHYQIKGKGSESEVFSDADKPLDMPVEFGLKNILNVASSYLRHLIMAKKNGSIGKSVVRINDVKQMERLSGNNGFIVEHVCESTVMGACEMSGSVEESHSDILTTVLTTPGYLPLQDTTTLLRKEFDGGVLGSQILEERAGCRDLDIGSSLAVRRHK